MKYYVISPDGTKYGPADADVLTQWISEGRINASTMVQSEASGESLAVSAVPGVFITVRPGEETASPTNWSQPPSHNPYPRNVQTNQMVQQQGSNEFILSWVFFGITFVTACCPILPGLGVYFASRAVQAGYPNANVAKIMNIVLLCLSGLGYLAYAAFIIFAITVGSSV